MTQSTTGSHEVKCFQCKTIFDCACDRKRSHEYYGYPTMLDICPLCAVCKACGQKPISRPQSELCSDCAGVVAREMAMYMDEAQRYPNDEMDQGGGVGGQSTMGPYRRRF